MNGATLGVTDDGCVRAITTHARKRGHERLGLPASAVERMAEKALRLGMPSDAMGGALRRFAESKWAAHPDGKLMLYGEDVFIFTRRDVLVTCYRLPAWVLKTARTQWQRWKGGRCG